jgi:hypothetical protein
MTVNGLQLPASFVEFYQQDRQPFLVPKEGVDAY